MLKTLSRIIAVLLVPCLLADQSLAFSKQSLNPRPAHTTLQVAQFQEQALEPINLWVHRAIAGLKTAPHVRVLAGVAAAGVIVEALIAHPNISAVTWQRSVWIAATIALAWLGKKFGFVPGGLMASIPDSPPPTQVEKLKSQELAGRKIKVIFWDWGGTLGYWPTGLADGAAEFLQIAQSRGMKNVLVTSAPRNEVDHWMQTHGINPLFVDILCPLDKEHPIDKATAIQDYLEKHRSEISPAETIGMGDDPVKDLAAYKQAGISSIGVLIPKSKFTRDQLVSTDAAALIHNNYTRPDPILELLGHGAESNLSPKVRRVVGIFVHMPNGDVVVHVRAHWKSNPFKISAFGGGVEDGETPAAAALREIAEELDLPKGYQPTGTLTELAKDQALPGDAKDERIDIFRYTLADIPNEVLEGKSEAAIVVENMEKLRVAQETATNETAYKAYLEAKRDANPGDGEVWRIYALPMDQLVQIAHGGSATFREHYADGDIERKVGMVGGLAYVLKLPDMESTLSIGNTGPSFFKGLGSTILSTITLLLVSTALGFGFLVASSVAGLLPRSEAQVQAQTGNAAIMESQKFYPGPQDFYRMPAGLNPEFASFYDFVKKDGDQTVRDQVDLRGKTIIVHLEDNVPVGAEVQVSLYPTGASLRSPNSLVKTKGENGTYGRKTFKVDSDHTITIDIDTVGMAPGYREEYMSKVYRIAVHSKYVWGETLNKGQNVEAKAKFFEIITKSKKAAAHVIPSGQETIADHLLVVMKGGKAFLLRESNSSVLHSDPRTLTAA